MADQASATRTYFLKPICLGITPFISIRSLRISFSSLKNTSWIGLFARQIAKEIFSSKTAVLEALARFGIPIREPHQHHGHPSQPLYGKRFRKNILVDYKVEKKIVLIIKDLREQGFSLRKIAKILNAMAVNTKCHGNVWHPEMVRRA